MGTQKVARGGPGTNGHKVQPRRARPAPTAPAMRVATHPPTTDPFSPTGGGASPPPWMARTGDGRPPAAERARHEADVLDEQAADPDHHGLAAHGVASARHWAGVYRRFADLHAPRVDASVRALHDRYGTGPDGARDHDEMVARCHADGRCDVRRGVSHHDLDVGDTVVAPNPATGERNVGVVMDASAARPGDPASGRATVAFVSRDGLVAAARISVGTSPHDDAVDLVRFA